MASGYSRLNPPVTADSSRGLLNESQNDPTNPDDVPLESMARPPFEDWTEPISSEGSFNDPLGSSKQAQARFRNFGTHRTNSAFSIKSVAGASPWEHGLNEKHLREVPTTTDTVRYFDPRRQRRRVFLECLKMWFWTAGICGALAGIIYGFSTLVALTQTQKYVYNALVTGLSIVLGLAFAAQFKQYAEMMRWRFLASQYRTIQDFDEVLDCHSYRNALRIMWRARRPGTWYPSKAQIVAACWVMAFVTFNVCAALLGLTYSIDVSDTNVSLSYGPISVAATQYIAGNQQPDNGTDYQVEFQKSAANLWGRVGQNFPNFTDTLDDDSASGQFVFQNEAGDTWWYRFVDQSVDLKNNVVSERTVTSQATCVEYDLLYGGYAGLQTDNFTIMWEVDWVDENGNEFSDMIYSVATASTTWMGNSSSQTVGCGPRCARILALQSADNVTVTVPRLWSCNNTVGQVANWDADGFDDPEALQIPDDQAFYLAGAIGWSGVDTENDDLQFVLFDGDTIFNPADTTADYIATLVMRFTVGALAASDNLNGPRQNLTGAASPSPAQIVNVKWDNAAAILGGIPLVQFIMLLCVVWFASKAIILEPSAVTAAHLLHPVLQKLGKDGSLLTVDEMAERLGPDYKIAYGVRPNAADPGHHDTTFVRDLDVIEEAEGHGYIRGQCRREGSTEVFFFVMT